MKNRLHPFLGTLASIVFSIGLSQSSNAAALTWDADTVTAGSQDGSDIPDDIWGVTGQLGNWRNTTTSTDNVNWTAGDTATFGSGTDGTYSVTVGGAVTTGIGSATVGALNFVNSGYTLSASAAQQITVGSGAAASYVTVASGITATIGNNVTLSKGGTAGALNILSGGTLKIDSGGAISNTFANANDVAGGSTLWINGGTVSYGTSLVIGQLNTGDGLGGNLIVDSGSLSIGRTGNLNVGRANGDVSVATLNDGTITAAGGNLAFGSTATSTGTFHLNGGTLTVKAVTDTNSTSTLNFNGGTLKAAASASGAFMTGLNTAQVRNGGAKFDTNGQSITIGQALIHSTITSPTPDDATDGGLTKEGTGTLTLTGANTYTGATTINGGKLAITAPYSAITATTINNTGRLKVNSNGTSPSSLSTVSVNTGGGFEFDLGNFNAANQPAVNVGSLEANANYTVDIAGVSIPSGATITLLTYTSKTGSGLPSIGTMPAGMTLTSGPTDTGSSIQIVVNTGSATLFTWSKGDGDWDTSSLNWNANAAAYAEPAVVTFPDLVEAVNGVNEVNVTTNSSPATFTINNTGDYDTNAYSFSGAGGISGATGITKTGAGLVTFSNPNSYSGALAVNAGAVIKTAADTTSGNITVADSASFVLSGGITDGSGQTLTIAGPGQAAAYFSATSETQRGSLQSHSGNNVWDGNIILTGTAGIGGNTRIGVQDGASLTLNGNISENIAGMSPLFRAGDSAAETITINGLGSWTGTTRLFSAGGVIKLGASDRFPTIAPLNAGSVASPSVTIFDLAGYNQTAAGLTGDGTGRILNSGTASILTSNPVAACTFSGIMQGDISFVIGGTAIQTLSGANTYTGNTTVNTGGALTVAATTGQLRFKPTTNGVTNSVGGTGTVAVNGKFVVDLTGASTTSGNTWTIVDKSTLTATFSDTTFAIETSAAVAFTDPENDGIWTLVDGSNTWNFSEGDGTLTVTSAVSGYAAWQSANAPGQTVDQDHDNDGVDNGIEYFMGESGTTFTVNPSIVSGAITWPMVATYTGTYGTHYVVQTSPDLITWTPAIVGVGAGFVAITPATSVTYTLPAPAGKLFVRLLVNPN